MKNDKGCNSVPYKDVYTLTKKSRTQSVLFKTQHPVRVKVETNYYGLIKDFTIVVKCRDDRDVLSTVTRYRNGRDLCSLRT